MKNVRYIIGSLAIMAILFMNFRYAYHNYGGDLIDCSTEDATCPIFPLILFHSLPLSNFYSYVFNGKINGKINGRLMIH